MLVFIDESGDCGMKLEGGSSQHFVIAAVIFGDDLSASSCDRAIDDLRRNPDLQLKRDFEFHFTHCSDRIRTAFFRAVAQEEFYYHAFSIDKSRVYGKLFNDNESFYQFAVRIVCDNARMLLNDAKVVIDKSGDRRFNQRLETALKSQFNDDSSGQRRIRKVKMEDSRANNLVQLADMVCGAVRRHACYRDSEFRRLIQKREKRISCWPQK